MENRLREFHFISREKAERFVEELHQTISEKGLVTMQDIAIYLGWSSYEAGSSLGWTSIDGYKIYSAKDVIPARNAGTKQDIEYEYWTVYLPAIEEL